MLPVSWVEGLLTTQSLAFCTYRAAKLHARGGRFLSKVRKPLRGGGGERGGGEKQKLWPTFLNSFAWGGVGPEGMCQLQLLCTGSQENTLS